MHEIIIAACRCLFLLVFLLAVSIWPKMVNLRTLLLVGHVMFALSLLVHPVGMFYYEMHWDFATFGIINFLRWIRFTQDALLLVAIVLGIVSVMPWRTRQSMVER